MMVTNIQSFNVLEVLQRGISVARILIMILNIVAMLLHLDPVPITIASCVISLIVLDFPCFIMLCSWGAATAATMMYVNYCEHVSCQTITKGFPITGLGSVDIENRITTLVLYTHFTGVVVSVASLLLAKVGVEKNEKE